MLVEAESILGLVEDGAARRAVDLTILGAAGLVRGLLSERLVRVGLDATGMLLVKRLIITSNNPTERQCLQRR